MTNMDALFLPESVAHVGASIRPVPGRFNFTQYLIHLNYQGQIYPVNPKYEEMFERPCYPDLATIPGSIDLAILAVPATACVEVLRSVPAGKIKYVVIHTSGFGELDKGHLEAELLELARDKGFRVVGPNCMGVYSQQGRIGFWKEHWEIVDRPGALGFISQSGGHAVNALLSGIDSAVSFDKVISLGNQIDLTIGEVLEYMGNDDRIRAIGLYVEEIKEGRRFLETLRQVVRRKPVVVWKGGVTSVGKEAAVSHTGSLAGDEKIFASALRQSGAISVDNLPLMMRVLRVLQPQFSLPGGKLAIFSPGGGNTVSVCDLFSAQRNLSLPRFIPEVMNELREILPEENVDVRNPVDPGATGYLKLDKLMKAVGNDPQIDTLIILMGVDYLSNIESEDNRLLAAEMISETVARFMVKIGKPVFILLRQERKNHEDFDRYRRIMVAKFTEKKLPWIDGSFKSVAEVMSKVVGYHDHLERLGKQGSRPAPT